jgi:hypothetical protein
LGTEKKRWARRWALRREEMGAEKSKVTNDQGVWALCRWGAFERMEYEKRGTRHDGQMRCMSREGAREREREREREGDP